MSNIEDASWMGERIGDLPREKLLEIIEYFSKQAEGHREESLKNSRALAYGKIALWRRGEAA